MALHFDSSTPIAITGLKHSGKTTLAPRIARGLDRAVLDLDDEVLAQFRRLYAAPGGDASLRSYYTHFGKEAFMELEREVATALFSDGYDGVLACGGGVADNEALLDLLARKALIVYLTADFDTLFERIRRGGIPPFLDPEEPYKSFLALAERRDRKYRAAAHLTVATENKTVAEAAELAIGAIKEIHHAG